jgi:hypothetical protein
MMRIKPVMTWKEVEPLPSGRVTNPHCAGSAKLARPIEMQSKMKAQVSDHLDCVFSDPEKLIVRWETYLMAATTT